MKQKTNKMLIFTSLAAYFTYFIHGIGASILGQYKPEFAAAWGAKPLTDGTLDVSMVVSVIAALGLGRLISLPFSGPLSDKYGRKLSGIIGVLCYVAYFFGMANSTSMAMGYAFAVIGGIANSFLDTCVSPTCMEIYVAYKDYNWMMEFTEKMIEKICLDVNGTTEVKVGDNIIDFKAPYKRVTMLDSIKEHTGYDLTGMEEEEIHEVCKKLNMEIDDTMGKGKLIDEIFGEFCEGTYIQPTFITDYPIEMSPLTKKHRNNPELTERFELMVNGKELCNAYSELNDPIDQLERFEEQMKLSEKGDDEAMIIDKDFVRALEYGMPPTSGMGIGMDRLVMLMTGQSTIQEVLFFPQMRPEKVVPKDSVAKFMELGIPEEWVPLIQKAGYNLISDMKEVNPQKLHMDICGINKKYKLELNNPSVDTVAGWISKID